MQNAIKEAKNIERQSDLKKNQLRELMQDCIKADGLTWKVNYNYQKGRATFDKEAFIAAHPEITDLDTFFKQGENEFEGEYIRNKNI